MSNLVRYDATPRVAVLPINTPPVTALGPGVLEAIEEAIARGLDDPHVDALVLIGAGQTFVAGADINVFKTIKSRDQSLERSQQSHARLLRFEDATKPLVAAVHGNALGGGLELAMACHYRVATADARVGQPEVLLGIIPGAGGTQRLPRLAGPAMALEMCTEGKPVPATRAQSSGILDRVVSGGLRQAAITFAGERAGEVRKTRHRTEKIADRAAGLAACAAVRTALGTTARGARAPFLAVDAIEAALPLNFHSGSPRDLAPFTDGVDYPTTR